MTTLGLIKQWKGRKKVETRNFDIRKSLIKFDDVMNDQRQVIFSQRLKILKGDNVEEILSDFLDEILKNLDNIKNSFQKSNDEKKYLTSIKNVTGNAISDAELIEMTSLDQKQFIKKIKDIYLAKNKRTELIGVKKTTI